MVFHHLLIELLTELGQGRDLGLPGVGFHQVQLQLPQLILFAGVPAAPEVVAQPGELGEIAGLFGPGRQGCQQRLELTLETGRQVFDGHLHGVEPGEIQQITVDVPLQRLGLGIIHRPRVFAHLAHEAIQTARQQAEALLHAAIAGLLAPQQIDGVGIDPVEDQLCGHAQIGGALLLAQQLPAIGRERQQRYDDKAKDNTMVPCNTLHPVSILMSWSAIRCPRVRAEQPSVKNN
ncbi:hypothetical protein D3C72_1186110 [compost metagenome]